MDRISDAERQRIAELVAEGAPVWRLHKKINRSRYAIRRAVALRRSARLALHPRADLRHGAEYALPDDELAATRTGAAARAVSSGLRRAGRGAPGAGAHLVHEHRRDPGDGGQDQPRLTACISGNSQP